MKLRSANFRNLNILVVLGVMTSMAVILERVVRLDLGSARFSLACVCTMICSLWFGPVCGGLVGGMQDVIGCLLSGYPPNVLILASAVMYGVLPAILVSFFSKKIRSKAAVLSLSTAITMAVCSFGLTMPGLILFYGYHPLAVLQMRLVQYLIMMPVYCIVLCGLYLGPLTRFVRQHILKEEVS